MTRHDQGLTLVEVIVALAMLAVLSTAAVTAYLSSIQGNQAAAMSSRASQLIAGLTAQVNQHTITLASGTSETRTYSQTNFTTPIAGPVAGSTCALAAGSRNYCVVITNAAQYNPVQGSATVLSTPAERYTIRACWLNRGATTCAQADTLY